MILSIVPQLIKCFYEVQSIENMIRSEIILSSILRPDVTSCFPLNSLFSRLATSNNSKPAVTLTDAWAFTHVKAT